VPTKAANAVNGLNKLADTLDALPIRMPDGVNTQLLRDEANWITEQIAKVQVMQEQAP
jgi:multidrug efflux pump subunit AcrB